MKRWFIAVCALLVLLVSFQFRALNFTALALGFDADDLRPWIVISNKVIRYLINDFAALVLLWVLFQRRDYLQLAVLVLLFGLFILLPLYFVGYFYLRESLGITLSYLHRLIMNPTLMMLLIPLFYFQMKNESVGVKGKE